MCFKETMKDILVLLVLLSVRTTEVCSQPYEADSDGKCRNSTAEYLLDDSVLCCKKCPPGQRLLQMCSENTETVCQQCGPGQYIETWNYAKNCLSCNKCKSSKGLQYDLYCSYTTRTRCMCQPGMYCMLESDGLCTECRTYTRCKPGYGVSVPGRAKSDVRCKRCPDGMFSDTHSSTDPCRPHTNCPWGAVVRKANATSDNVCEREVVTATLLQDTTKENRNDIVFTNANTIRSTVFAVSDSTLSVRPSVTKEVFNNSTESRLQHKVPDIKLAATIAGAIGLILLFIIIILGFLFKVVWKKDAARFHPKVDANGNCESVDEQITQGYLEETQLTVFTFTSPEQQCLLEGAGACSDYSQPSSNIETLTRTNGCNGHESVGPLQSTLALNNPNSVLSEPMTLISNAGPVTPQPSGPSQSSSQPNSPQIISPVTTSPLVNVNITFHIGNGSCVTPPVVPVESNNHLPFGEEEESFSIPQQEDGKRPPRSVQDSESYSV